MADIMPTKYNPKYSITPQIASSLMRIEAAKVQLFYLPLTTTVLSSLRETARLYTTHYSTMIEGNRLGPDQIEHVIKHEGHFPGRERDEREVKGYYAALHMVDQTVAAGRGITEKTMQSLHALVMAGGRIKVKPTKYRDGQNAIRDSRTKNLVYMPPEAKDVPSLIRQMVKWIVSSKNIPCPIVAAIAHYQFATIHPYYDGNGRTARLLTTLILHLGSYDLKGLYSLEEYYARNLTAYYQAISICPSHNYYLGRAEAEITQWVEYFVAGMADSFENVMSRMAEAEKNGNLDHSPLIRKLDPRQRKVLDLFLEFEVITSRQVADLFGFRPRTSSQLCASWVDQGFLMVLDFSNKGRKYELAKQYRKLIP